MDLPVGELEIEAAHRLTFPDSQRIYGITFSPDGRTLYVRLHDEAINVWATLVAYWPEIGGVLAGITTMICLLLLWRVMRRPRHLGQPHCRRCNYCLTGCPSDRCPECGNSTARPVVGRTFRRRTWAIWSVLAVVLLPYGALWAAWAPRVSRVNSAFEWWSPALADYVTQGGLTGYFSRVMPIARIEAVDVRSGQIRRTVALRLLALWDSLFDTTPDGAGLLIRKSTRGPILLIDTDDGRTLGRLDEYDARTVFTGDDESLLGFSEDGHTAYLHLLNEQEQRSRVVAWNMQAGGTRTLLELDADACELDGSEGREFVLPRRLILISPEPDLRVVEFPSRHGAEADSVTVRVHDLRTEPRVVAEFTLPIWAHETPQVWNEGNRVYARTRSGPVRGYDLESGEAVHFMQFLWSPYWLTGTPTHAQRGRLILVKRQPRLGEDLVIHHLETGRVIAKLPLGDRLLRCQKVVYSDDGMWLAVLVTRVERLLASEFTQEVLIFDLRPLQERSAEAADP
jgi:hypothetical protein